jgi:hypothetical protein
LDEVGKSEEQSKAYLEESITGSWECKYATT